METQRSLWQDITPEEIRLRAQEVLREAQERADKLNEFADSKEFRQEDEQTLSEIEQETKRLEEQIEARRQKLLDFAKMREDIEERLTAPPPVIDLPPKPTPRVVVEVPLDREKFCGQKFHGLDLGEVLKRCVVSNYPFGRFKVKEMSDILTREAMGEIARKGKKTVPPNSPSVVASYCRAWYQAGYMDREMVYQTGYKPRFEYWLTDEGRKAFKVS